MELIGIGLIALLVGLLIVLLIPKATRSILQGLRCVLEPHATALDAYFAVYRATRTQLLKLHTDHEDSSFQLTREERRKAARDAAVAMRTQVVQ